MVRSERSSRRGRSGSRSKSPRRGSRERISTSPSFEEHQKNRSSGRSSRNFRSDGRSSRGRDRGGRGRKEVEMTKVICSSCGIECEVPFKPTSSKPVYCSNCYVRVFFL